MTQSDVIIVCLFVCLFLYRDSSRGWPERSLRKESKSRTGQKSGTVPSSGNLINWVVVTEESVEASIDPAGV